MGRNSESADGKLLLDPNGPRLVFGVLCKPFKRMAGTTGLEPAASAVTGQRSNQLNYVPTLFSPGYWETIDFPVFSYCPPRRLCQPFPPHITEFRGLMDRKWTGSQRPNPVARPYDPAHLSMHRG